MVGKMQIITLSIVFFAAFVVAQNPFSLAPLPQSIPVGTPFNITWLPSTGTVDTVTLVLRQGPQDDLATIQTIACKSVQPLSFGQPSKLKSNLTSPQPRSKTQALTSGHPRLPSSTVLTMPSKSSTTETMPS